MEISAAVSVTRVFTYFGNTIMVNGTKAGAFHSPDSITLDDRGRPLNLRQFYQEDRSDWSNIAFTYNGDDLLTMKQSTDQSTNPVTSLVACSNGNMVCQQLNGNIVMLEYFLDKKVQPGDFLQFNSLPVFGIDLFRKRI